MKTIKLSIMVAALISFTHLAVANNITNQKVAEFNIPYNANRDFKMDIKENIAYLASVTQENNNKVLHLYSMQESSSTQSDPQHKVAVSNDLLNGITITDQDPTEFKLAVHYDPNDKTSNQYIAYIDKNQKNALVILQRYPCEPTGNYCVRIISQTVPMNEIDTMDMAVQKDGNLLVSTVDYSRRVHLYKYLTHFYGTAPEPITLVGQNSQLILPNPNNYGEFKLVLAGANEVPYVVFPCGSSDSNQPKNGRIGLANITSWDQSNNPKIWSNSYISDDSTMEADHDSQIDAIASPNDSLIHIALIANFDATNKHSDKQFELTTFDSNHNQFIQNIYQKSGVSAPQLARYPKLASDGYSTYALYDLDTPSHARCSAHTGAEFINSNSSYNNSTHQFNQYEVAGKDNEDYIKYTGIVMYSKDYTTSYYRGFVLATDGNSSNMVIKGIVFNN